MCTSASHFLITNQFNDQLPFGSLAQLVRALHLYCRGQDPNPVQTGIFSGFLITTAEVASLSAMIFAINTYVSRSTLSLASFLLSLKICLKQCMN